MVIVRRLSAFLAALAAAALVAYALLLCVIAALQERMVYPAAGGGMAEAAPGWRRVVLRTVDGSLVAYHHPGSPGMPTAMFLHGNGSGYRDSIIATAELSRRGIGILIPEYPGYGGNPGRPREAALQRTADAAMDWLERHGTPPRRIAVYGNSLGAGPAIHAALRPHGMLVLVSPLSSLSRAVAERLPMAPTAILRDVYDNVTPMRRVQGPVTVIHAVDDDVVPYRHGRALAAAAKVPLLSLDTGGHAIAFDARVAARVADIILEVLPPIR